MSNKIYPQKDISKIVFKKRLKLLLLANAKKENKLFKKIERKRRQIGREVICKSWVFSLSVLKILLTNFPWFDVEKWFSWFLCLYVYFSFHFFLSFFFWKHTNVPSVPVSHLSLWKEEGSENRSRFVVFNQTSRHYNDSSYTNCYCYSTTANGYDHVNYIRGPLGSFRLSSLAIKDALVFHE